MKILFLILSGKMGGLERHVQCLAQSLPKSVETLICVVGPDGSASLAMREAGLNVVTLGCMSGHDVRLFPRFHRVMKTFKPDVVHSHSISLFASCYLKWFSNVPLIQSLHTPAEHRTWKDRVISMVAKTPDYFLPVSAETWKGYQKIFPKAKGEELFNPLRLEELPEKDGDCLRRELGLERCNPIVGAVGRMSHPKNWFAFLDVSLRLLFNDPKLHMVAVGDGPQEAELHTKWEQMTKSNLPVRARLHWLGNRQDAKRLIGGMDVFLFLSHHEELPTVLLEAFGMRTPVVGFLPRGGTKEVLALSEKESAWLIEEQDANAAADNVLAILKDSAHAEAMVCAGHEIVTKHFDAGKICCGQLMNVYRRIVG